MHHLQSGVGRPLLLIHGLGGSWRSWTPVLAPLAERRQVVAIDLPGFGETPPLPGEVSIATLADATTDFLAARRLIGVDAVGSSMGARLVLELARRGVLGATVALDPGGFWQGWERSFFHRSIGLSVRLLRLLRPVMPWVTGNALGRTLLLSQLSVRPWALSADLALSEMHGYADSPSFDPLLHALVSGPEQRGAAAGATLGPLTIGWGRQDRVCLPRQAARALQRFPGARLHWFERCGHFPHWDQPQQAVRLILEATGEGARAPTGPPSRSTANATQAAMPQEGVQAWQTH
jgi:pimeloyl-ACP methyl ester carboxylesterase